MVAVAAATAATAPQSPGLGMRACYYRQQQQQQQVLLGRGCHLPNAVHCCLSCSPLCWQAAMAFQGAHLRTQ
jgi:hypothetical protein